MAGVFFRTSDMKMMALPRTLLHRDTELMQIPTNSSNRSPLQEVPRVPLVKISLHVPGHFGPNVKGRCPDQDIGSDLCFNDEAPLPTVSAACLPFVTLNPGT